MTDPQSRQCLHFLFEYRILGVVWVNVNFHVATSQPSHPKIATFQASHPKIATFQASHPKFNTSNTSLLEISQRYARYFEFRE